MKPEAVMEDNSQSWDKLGGHVLIPGVGTLICVGVGGRLISEDKAFFSNTIYYKVFLFLLILLIYGKLIYNWRYS